MDNIAEDNILSPLSFNQYIAMFCFWDSEWSKERPLKTTREDVLKKSLYDKSRYFNLTCQNVKNNIDKNYSSFCKANNYSSEVQNQGKLKPYLFNPINFITFGHSDNLSIVLLDDFDPVHHITSAPKTTIEDVSIAFVPKIDSLNLNNLNLERYSEEIKKLELEEIDFSNIVSKIFIELHELPNNEFLSFSEKEIKQHHFQDEKPLMIYTKFKTSGHGLLFQYALLRAIAIKVLFTYSRLLKTTPNDSNEIHDSIINIDDLKSLNVAFLDLQGTEEVGVLLFSKNYNLATTIIASLRSMIWNDLFKADNTDQLINHYNFSLFQKLNREIPQTNFKINEPNQQKTNNQNHVFLYSHTTLAIAPKQFIISSESQVYSGYVSAFTEVQISPGHQSYVEQHLIRETICDDLNYLKSFNKSNYHRYVIGVSDYLFIHKCNLLDSQSSTSSSLKVLPLSSVLEILRKNLYFFGSIDKDLPLSEQGRHIIDITTNFIIPVPKITDKEGNEIIFTEIDKDHISFISESLSLLRKNLFYYSENLEENEEIKIGETKGRLDIPLLHKIPAKYGLPVSLRRNIEYLFQNYATIFADPYCYESILDLYDAFSALHILLTEKLPIIFSNFQIPYKESSEYIDADSINQLSIIVNALYDSILHRTSKTYPQANYRDMGIDFRGGLNQMLFAADAPIKSTLELLQKILEELNGNKNVSVGGIIKIGILPGAHCTVSNFNVKNEVKIASFELDVPHVLHPTSYIDNLHEVGHLIFDAIDITNMFHQKLVKNESEQMQSRINEIFAMLICNLFIFGSDISKFAYYEISNYSKSHSSTGISAKETIVKFTEFIIRLFIVIDLIPELSEDTFQSEQFDINAKIDCDLASERFSKFFYKFAPLFSEYKLLFLNDLKVQQFSINQFKILYPNVLPYIEQLWLNALNVYSKFMNDLNNEDIRDLRKLIDEAFAQGRPMLTKFLEQSQLIKHPNTPSNFLSLFLICQSLYQYIPNPEVTDVYSKRIHLYRDDITRDVSYHFSKDAEEGSKVWFEYQIDKGLSSMFCPVPDIRSERLKKQIVLFKTFWDISAAQRENIMKRIVENNSY